MRRAPSYSKALALRGIPTDIDGDGVPEFTRSSVVGAPVTLSGTPEWLPEDALLYADFVNGNYYYEGEIEAADLLSENAEEWNEFDPETGITADGLVGNPIIAPAIAAALIASGFTVVADVTPHPGGEDHALARIECFDPPDWTGEWIATAMWDTTETWNSSVQVYDGEFSDLEETPAVVGTSPYRFAATLQPGEGHIAMSVNGGAVLEITNDPPEVVTHTVGIFTSGGKAAITTLTIYAPQDDGDLPALSTLA